MTSTDSASEAASTTSFTALGVPARLVRALQDAGIAAPFPIQADTLPDTLGGRDVLGRGRTGSGKTLAFAIPVVARLAGDLAGTARPHRPVGLILAPTRELATQIATALEPLAGAHAMKVTTIFGGVSQNRQVKALAAGADIVVACPGRLEDLMRQGLVDLGSVGITVIDEADHMADLGFLPGVTRILAATPAGGQRLLFSATLDNGVDKLVKRFLPGAVLHSVDEAHSPVDAMTHHVFEVANPAVKKDVVRTLASGSGRRILFMRTKHQARKLAKTLTAEGIPAVDLHGNLAQNARDRNLAAFAEGAAKVLVATDVAARGVHVDGVELVVHVDPPAEHKAYLHRSGRTARAGSAGDVVTLVLPDQRKDTAALLRKAAISVRPQPVTADSRAVGDLVGVIAPVVAPSPVVVKSPGNAGTRTRTGRSDGNAEVSARRGRGDAPARTGRGAKTAGAVRTSPGRGGDADSDRRRNSEGKVSQEYSGAERDGRAGGGRGSNRSGRDESGRRTLAGSRADGSRGRAPESGGAVRQAPGGSSDNVVRQRYTSDRDRDTRTSGDERAHGGDARQGRRAALNGDVARGRESGVRAPGGSPRGGRTGDGRGARRDQRPGRSAGAESGGVRYEDGRAANHGARQELSSGGRARPEHGEASRTGTGRRSADRPGRAPRSDVRESHSNRDRGGNAGRHGATTGGAAHGAGTGVKTSARQPYSSVSGDGRRDGAGRPAGERSGAHRESSGTAGRSGAGAPAARRRRS